MGLFRRLVFAISSIFLVICPARATTKAFFTSQESVESELVRLIDESHSTIDLALFRFASQPLAMAINRAHTRHVRLRLVLDGHPEAEGKTNALGTAFAAGDVRRLDGKRGGSQGIMHHKFVLFDNARVVTGSFNWTAGAEHANYENALLLDDSDVVTAYSEEFERLWERAKDIVINPTAVTAPNFKGWQRESFRTEFPISFNKLFARKKHRRRSKKFRCL